MRQGILKSSNFPQHFSVKINNFHINLPYVYITLRSVSLFSIVFIASTTKFTTKINNEKWEFSCTIEIFEIPVL